MILVSSQLYEARIGRITLRSDEPIDRWLREVVARAHAANARIMPCAPTTYTIEIRTAEDGFRRAAGPYYGPRVAGVGVKRRVIALRSKRAIERMGGFRSNPSYEGFVAHEINHVFWRELVDSWQPQWFVEGLACSVGDSFQELSRDAKRLIEAHDIDHHVLDYRYLRRSYARGHVPRYPVWRAFVDYLRRTRGTTSLTSFMLGYAADPTRNGYVRSFREAFGSTPRVAFSAFKTSLGLTSSSSRARGA